MRWMLCLLLLCFTALEPSFARAEVVEALSWNDCVIEARANNPDLVSSRAKLDQAKAAKAVTRSTILPQLSASAGADTSKTEGNARGETYSYGVTGRQLLFDGFKTAHDLAAAQENIKAASYEYQVTSSNVRLSLQSAFIQLLGAQESLGVTQGIVERRKQNLELVELRYKVGREHKGALLTAQANAAEADFEFQQAQRNVDLCQRRLSKVLGREKFRPIKASGDLKVAGVDPLRPDFEELVGATPLLKELVAKKESAKSGLKSARADLFPQIYLDGSTSRTGEEWSPDTRKWSAGLSFSIPIFEGGRKQATITKARANVSQVEADERSGRDGVILTLAETWTQWQDDAAQVAVQAKFLEASSQRSEIAEAQYSSGLVTFNDWTLIEDDLVRDQKAVLQAKTSALISEAAWRQAKGETLDE